MKICLKCGQLLLIKEFYKDSSKKDGLSNWCGECCKKYSKKYYEQNKDKYREKNKKYYEQNKDRVKAWGKKYRNQNKGKIKVRKRNYYVQNKERCNEIGKKNRLISVYGITYAEKIEIYKLQGKKCAICKKPTSIDQLHVDHEHNKNQDKRKSVRGLLCHYCNSNLLPGYERAFKTNPRLHNSEIDIYLSQRSYRWLSPNPW